MLPPTIKYSECVIEWKLQGVLYSMRVGPVWRIWYPSLGYVSTY